MFGFHFHSANHNDHDDRQVTQTSSSSNVPNQPDNQSRQHPMLDKNPTSSRPVLPNLNNSSTVTGNKLWSKIQQLYQHEHEHDAQENDDSLYECHDDVIVEMKHYTWQDYHLHVRFNRGLFFTLK